MEHIQNTDSHYFDENERFDENSDTNESVQNFLQIGDLSDIDILDDYLYSYDSMVLSIPHAIQQEIFHHLFRKVEDFVDSIPAVGKAVDSLSEKTEYIPRFDLLSDEIKQALEEKLVEMTPCKDSTDGSYYLQIRTIVDGLTINGKQYGKHKKIKDVPLGTKTIPVDTLGAMQCLAMQNQLSQIANGLREISEVCEINFSRIIQGQRDDRLAKVLSARSNFVQALAISDEKMQRYMLQEAIKEANYAHAMLAQQIRSDIITLSGGKALKSKDMEGIVHDIRVAIVAMNNVVQLALYSYQFLGEHKAQLAVVKEHKIFTEQVLLKKIEQYGKNFEAWKLICSSGNSDSVLTDSISLPKHLIESCTEFIEERKPIAYLEDKK